MIYLDSCKSAENVFLTLGSEIKEHLPQSFQLNSIYMKVSCPKCTSEEVQNYTYLQVICNVIWS